MRGYTRGDGPVRPDHAGHRGGADRVRPPARPLPSQVGIRRSPLAADALTGDGGAERDRRSRSDARGHEPAAPCARGLRAHGGVPARSGRRGRPGRAGTPRDVPRAGGHPPDARGHEREATPPWGAGADRGAAARRRGREHLALARVLIVGCGCRGRSLARALLADGHAVRGTTREPAATAGLRVDGIEPWVGDPDRIGTLTGALDGVTVACWLLGSATGEPETLAALHGPRLRSFCERVVDTTVRGLVYEAAGTVPAGLLAGGAEIARE